MGGGGGCKWGRSLLTGPCATGVPVTAVYFSCVCRGPLLQIPLPPLHWAELSKPFHEVSHAPVFWQGVLKEAKAEYSATLCLPTSLLLYWVGAKGKLGSTTKVSCVMPSSTVCSC